MQLGPAPMQVRTPLGLFPTVKDAAKAHGVATCTVYWAIGRGREDRLGQGTLRPGNGKKRPFSIGWFHWPTMRAASRALGFNDQYVERAIRWNNRGALEKITARAMALQAAKEAKARRDCDEPV